MQARPARPAARRALILGLALGCGCALPACSSKPAQEDTAEVSPNPPIQPTPAPTPPAAEGATSAPAAGPAPTPEAKP